MLTIVISSWDIHYLHQEYVASGEKLYWNSHPSYQSGSDNMALSFCSHSQWYAEVYSPQSSREGNYNWGTLFCCKSRLQHSANRVLSRWNN